MQYALDLTRSWKARNSVTAWRSEVDDARANGSLHIVTESICPDRYHIVVSGITSSDTYYLGNIMYHRNGQDKWKTKTMSTMYRGPSFCRKNASETADDSRVRLVAEELRNINLSRPVIKEIAGRQCREWSRRFSYRNSVIVSTNCFAVETHELVQSKINNTVSTYYWNIPLEIKPPI